MCHPVYYLRFCYEILTKIFIPNVCWRLRDVFCKVISWRKHSLVNFDYSPLRTMFWQKFYWFEIAHITEIFCVPIERSTNRPVIRIKLQGIDNGNKRDRELHDSSVVLTLSTPIVCLLSALILRSVSRKLIFLEL